MTDKEALFTYRLKQAEETLLDAERMLQGSFSSRSITNRAYYSMFYAVLALFLKADMRIKTSKHIGVISIFDKEFILTEKIDKYYSEILHKMFNIRQKGDYCYHRFNSPPLSPIYESPLSFFLFQAENIILFFFCILVL